MEDFMLVRKENKFIRKESGLELDSSSKEPCKILNLSLSDFSVTKNLLVAHSGGLQVEEQKAIRTLACGKGMYDIKRIMIAYSSDMSLSRMKKYLLDHPKTILELEYRTNAIISKDRKYNFNISNIQRGDAVLHVLREKDTEINLVIKGIATI